jgi:hypothetical protein
MSNLIRFLLIGWALIFTVAACSPRGGQEQVPGGDEAGGRSGSSENDAAPLQGQTSQADPSESRSSRDYDDLEIVTLLPRDGIPAIDNPQFLSAEEADEEYAPDELVIGVNYDGDARAYSIPFLSSREIVNDTVGGRKIAVTW